MAFGDSYTYVQGTHGRQNYSFIRDLFDFSYTPEQLLTDHIVQNLVRSCPADTSIGCTQILISDQTGTAEGGPNYVEFLTECGVKPGLTLPRSCKRQLWNFAYAGSDVSEKL